MKGFKNNNGVEVVRFQVGNDPEILGFCCANLRQQLFEHQYPLTEGMSFDSYLIADEKVAVLDTVDHDVAEVWEEALDATLREMDRKPDYLIVQHLEPDHSSAIGAFVAKYPDCKVVCSAVAAKMLGQFADNIAADRVMAVTEGATLDLGSRQLQFFMAPMVHWPEVMVTYDPKSLTLFSADAFGTFGTSLALQIARGEADYSILYKEWREEGRRYYANICGKYGNQTMNLLKKAAKLEIRQLCPLHGPVIDLAEFNPVPLYEAWGQYRPDTDRVTVFAATLHGNTLAAARQFVGLLQAQGVDARLFDLAGADLSEAVSQAFASRGVAFFSPTYDAGLMPSVASLFARLRSKGYRNRPVALVENGSWAPMAGKLMRAEVEAMPGMTVAEPVVAIRTRMTGANATSLDELADNFAAMLPDAQPVE